MLSSTLKDLILEASSLLLIINAALASRRISAFSLLLGLSLGSGDRFRLGSAEGLGSISS